MCEVIAEEISKMRKTHCDFELLNEDIDVMMMRRSPQL